MLRDHVKYQRGEGSEMGEELDGPLGLASVSKWRLRVLARIYSLSTSSHVAADIRRACYDG